MAQVTLDQAMRFGLQCHQAGQLAEAAAIYRQVLAQQPKHAEALRLLGLIARQEGRLDEAAQLIQRSIAIDGAKAEAHHNLGDALWCAGKLDEAAAAYTKACQLQPDWAEAHGALGNVLRDQGKLDEAAAEYRKAIELNPTLPVGYVNLGRILHDQGKRDEAIDAYTKAILLRPDWAEAHNHLGNVLWDKNRLDEAVAMYEKADQLKPGYPEANWSMGRVLYRQGRKELAVECFQKVVRFNPSQSKSHRNLGDMLAAVGRRAEAGAEYRQGLALEPDSPDLQFKLAVLSGDGSVRTVPAQYVRKLFDDYAPVFDEHLVDLLNYRGPQQLLEAVLAATDRREFDILDLGCGTGLCGQQFRPYARRLVGVDLAPAMIRMAAARKIYDQLFTEDVITVMRQAPEQYDLVLAGDVLIYVGDLTEFMPAVAQALRPGGLFAFTIENHDGPGYFLHSDERFAHSLGYIRQESAKSGLREISIQNVSLRRHLGGQAAGSIIVVAKPA